ncbi:hypothetical protein VE02_02639 [Pseudogymnoascus sp. 03VT05]|nr:hypothetical protein VE02_02639 [Pseudogymnoascus sp. 03VT05]
MFGDWLTGLDKAENTRPAPSQCLSSTGKPALCVSGVRRADQPTNPQLILLELSALRSSHGNLDEAVAVTAGPPVNPMPEILNMNPEERDVETASTPDLAAN